MKQLSFLLYKLGTIVLAGNINKTQLSGISDLKYRQTDKIISDND